MLNFDTKAQLFLLNLKISDFLIKKKFQLDLILEQPFKCFSGFIFEYSW